MSLMKTPRANSFRKLALAQKNGFLFWGVFQCLDELSSILVWFYRYFAFWCLALLKHPQFQAKGIREKKNFRSLFL